jgi:hypothetical protein
MGPHAHRTRTGSRGPGGPCQVRPPSPWCQPRLSAGAHQRKHDEGTANLDRRHPASLRRTFVDTPGMGGPPGAVGLCGQWRGVPARGPPRPLGGPAGWRPADRRPGRLRDHSRATLGPPLIGGGDLRVGWVCPVAPGAGDVGSRPPRARGQRRGEARGVCRQWGARCSPSPQDRCGGP